MFEGPQLPTPGERVSIRFVGAPSVLVSSPKQLEGAVRMSVSHRSRQVSTEAYLARTLVAA